jgi:pilus assembly protein TadC
MFEELKKNLEHVKKIVSDMEVIKSSMEDNPENKTFYESSLRALADQIILVNRTVPEMLKEWSPVVEASAKGDSKASKKAANPKTMKVSYVSPSSKEKKFVSINKKDRATFLKKLKLSEDTLKSIADKKKKKEKKEGDILKPNAYVVFSNKYFRNYSDKISPNFDKLAVDLKKANFRFLLTSYLSMAIMSIIIAFISGFLLFAVLMVIDLGNWMYFFLPFGFAGLTMGFFYMYPSSEANAVKKKISQELPFVAIHMAAISGSDIEPTKIFKIVVRSGEYPIISKEIKKVIAQIDIYGYDLVTSLKNVAIRTSNKKFGELLSGLATNIASGGSLKSYLEDKAESFLLDYRLERQKYSDLAGTFMDVYISILIAAPLVLMMMFIVMNVSGLGMAGLGITALLLLSIGGIVIVNIVFLVVLNMKQPKV